MKYVIGLCAVALLAAAPVTASNKKRSSPGTVYYVNRELGRVHVMDHQQRLFVVSAQDIQPRARFRNNSNPSLRSGDQIWFRTVAGI